MDTIMDYLHATQSNPAFVLPNQPETEADGMDSTAIYQLLVSQVGPINTISLVAAEIKEARARVSQTIYYHRLNKSIRNKLRLKYGVTFSDKMPIRLNQQRQERKAA